jgi:iron(III) transport system ATP-binding protein
VINQGCIEQVGTPQEIYQQPRSAFVADFVGQTNPLQVQCLSPGRFNWHGVELSCVHTSPQSMGEMFTLALRPEDIVLHDHDRPHLQASNCYAAQVQDLEFLGAFCRVRVHLPINGQSLLADVPSAQASRMGLKHSRQVFVDLSAERMQVFGPNASVA